MDRKPSPPVSPEMAAHIRFLIKDRGLYQHQAASLLGVNQGRISEVMRDLIQKAEFAFLFTLVVGSLIGWPLLTWLMS